MGYISGSQDFGIKKLYDFRELAFTFSQAENVTFIEKSLHVSRELIREERRGSGFFSTSVRAFWIVVWTSSSKKRWRASSAGYVLPSGVDICHFSGLVHRERIYTFVLNPRDAISNVALLWHSSTGSQ